jgi:hypothetical protein
MSPKTERIRALNDLLRTAGLGGRIVITSGINALDGETQAAIMVAVQDFAQFTPDNDPHGEHDFGLLTVAGQRVMFKIDYYDRALRGHSPDPSDPTVTTRVLTIMRADEY